MMGPFTLNRSMVTLTTGLICLGLLSAGINCSPTGEATDLSEGARNEARLLSPLQRFQILQGDQRYLTKNAGGGLELRRLDNDRPIARIPGSGRKLTAFCASASGRLFVTVDQLGNVNAVRERGGEFHVHNICDLGRQSDCCCLSTNGQLVACGCEDGTVVLCSMPTGRLRFQLNCSQAPIDNIRFTPKGDQLLTVDVNGRMRLWNAATGEPVRDFSSAGLRILDVTFTPNGQQLLTVGTYGHVGIWNARSAEPIRKWSTGKHDSISVAVAHDGQRFAIGTLTGEISFWNTSTGAPLGKIAAATCAIADLQFSKDDSSLYFSGSHPGPARLEVATIERRQVTSR